MVGLKLLNKGCKDFYITCVSAQGHVVGVGSRAKVSLNQVLKVIAEFTEIHKARQNETHGVIHTGCTSLFRVSYKNEVKLCKN